MASIGLVAQAMLSIIVGTCIILFPGLLRWLVGGYLVLMGILMLASL